MTGSNPCLWFDGKAEKAARFYMSLLPDSRIDAVLPSSVETPGGYPVPARRVTAARLGMTKIDSDGLRRAREGRPAA